jgi:hypothetical protein
MAAADYWTCDLCQRAKTFYNSDDNGEDLVSTSDYADRMKVLCRACATTHEVVIVPRAVKAEEAGR